MKHDQTRIYQQTLQLVSLSKCIMDEMPLGFGFLKDQLRRAASSIALNFSEGYPKASLKEQRRYFRMAKASAYEVSAIFDVANCFAVISAKNHSKGKDLCDHIAAMITLFR